MAKDIRYTLLILAITLFTTANLYAQNSKCAIAGKVVDVSQKPIAYASAVSLGIYYPSGKQEFRILKVQMGNSDDKPTNE